jgi:hypothetical protein
LEDIRLRNPKLEDLGEVVNDCDILENFHLYDEKEFYLQIIDKNRDFSFINSQHPENCYHVLLREWNPDTWQLGPIIEVSVDRSTTANKFGNFV